METSRVRTRVVYVISDMSVLIDPDNVDIIKMVTELKGLDRNDTTYQKLYNERKLSLGMGYGVMRKKEGELFWELHSPDMGLYIGKDSDIIKVYNRDFYIENIFPLWDDEL